jgi:hypothetical protein
LDLCRLRHLRLHIETILHQARWDLPVPEMLAGIFIAQARLVPRSSPPDASRGVPLPSRQPGTRGP